MQIKSMDQLQGYRVIGYSGNSCSLIRKVITGLKLLGSTAVHLYKKSDKMTCTSTRSNIEKGRDKKYKKFSHTDT